MNHTLGGLAAALIVAAATPAFAQQAAKPAPAAAPAATLAKVNGVAIPASLVDLLVKEQVAQGATDGPELKTQVRDHLVRREVLLQAARKEGVDKKPEVRQRIEFTAAEMTVNSYIDGWVAKHPVSDEEARAEYARLVKEAGSTEYKVRHILVDNEDIAKDVIEKLKTGSNFADLSMTSLDPASRDKGGDLGWTRPAVFVKEFGDALVKLEKGQYTTEPVKSQFGFHVIKLDDKREADSPKFEDVKDRVVQSLQQKAVQAHVTALMGKAKIEQ